MNKKIVLFTGNVMFVSHYGQPMRAMLKPLDHPDTVNVTNTQEVITSPVLDYSENDDGVYRVETMNTIYLKDES